jgi:hypothetical protein
MTERIGYSAPVVTRDVERARMIRRVQEDLRKQAVAFSLTVIEQVLDAYDRRRSKQR